MDAYFESAPHFEFRSATTSTSWGSSTAGTRPRATASVVDPFGNILGLMRNPHYLEVLEGTH